MRTRHSVECWMVNPRTEVLLLHVRTSGDFPNGFWQPLTGGIENGESALEAAVREVHEETGLAVDPCCFRFVEDQIQVPITDDFVVSKSLFTVQIPEGPIVTSPDEHDYARFFSRSEVERRLSYSSNRMTWGQVRLFLD